MRRGNHHASVEAVCGGEVVDHRRRAKPKVAHFRARLGKPLHERAVNCVARRAAVAPHEPAFSLYDLRQGKPHLVDCIEVEVDTKGAAHVVCFEESHNGIIIA